MLPRELEQFKFTKFIYLLFPENEELFKERDRKDDNFLGRLKDLKIDTLEAPAQAVTILFYIFLHKYHGKNNF